jgi:hypothetical protein
MPSDRSPILVAAPPMWFYDELCRPSLVSGLMKDIYAEFRKQFSALDRIQCKSKFSTNLRIYLPIRLQQLFIHFSKSEPQDIYALRLSIRPRTLFRFFSFVRKVGIFILIGLLTTRQGVRCKLRYSWPSVLFKLYHVCLTRMQVLMQHSVRP